MLYLIMRGGCKEGHVFLYINITEHKIESAHTAEIACPIFTNRLHVLADPSKREGVCYFILIGIS